MSPVGCLLYGPSGTPVPTKSLFGMIVGTGVSDCPFAVILSDYKFIRQATLYLYHRKELYMGTKTKIAITAIISVVVSSVVTANIVGGLYQKYSALLPTKTQEQNLNNKLNTIRYFLDSQYLYDFDNTALTESAIKQYVEALDEPYTHYYTKDEFTQYTSSVEDGYMGIGIVITATEDKKIEVISTYEDSPAYKAGILPGDVLIKLDDKEYSAETMDMAVSYIRGGKVGTSVKVTVLRNGEEISYDVVRSDILTKSVHGQILDNGIGLVRLSGFNTATENSDRDTYTEFRDTVKNLQNEGMTKMILDLRDNPGGELQVVCNIADMILPEGTITYMEYKNGKKDTYKSDKSELDMPMVVLINGNSASASEVLTGAIKDYKKATIIGEKSYGKGIVQSVLPFYDGTGMSLTVAKYYSPNGVCIQGIGIEPDITVKMPEKYSNYYAATVPENEDTQLQKAIEVLSN